MGSQGFTHDKSYYPTPQTSMELVNVNFIQPLPSKVISPEIETAMKELVEKYRPVKQRDSAGRNHQRQSRCFATSSLHAATQFQ